MPAPRAIGVALNVGANLLAIRRWGPWGAAWRTVGSELLLCFPLRRANAVWFLRPLVEEGAAA